MRPPIRRPFSDLQNINLKFFDDATSATAIDLKKQLSPDPEFRPRPLTSNERSELILTKENNKLQDDLKILKVFADINNFFKINHQKTKVMVFNTSHKYLCPPELSLIHNEYLEMVSSA